MDKSSVVAGTSIPEQSNLGVKDPSQSVAETKLDDLITVEMLKQQKIVSKSVFTKSLNKLLFVLREDTHRRESIMDIVESMLEAEEKCLELMCVLSERYSHDRDYTAIVQVSKEMGFNVNLKKCRHLSKK